MRSLDTIDRELEFIAGVRTAIRRLGGHPSTHLVVSAFGARADPCRYLAATVAVQCFASGGPNVGGSSRGQVTQCHVV
jgi:hypothetical protein